MKTTIDLIQIRSDYEAFLQRKKSLMLSFVTPEGQAFSSSAAFVQVNGKFYVYVSHIADHYQLLEQNDIVDVLFVADEAVTQNHFATERARWQCAPKNLGNEGHEEVFEAFDAVHSKKMMQLLRTLDFSLFELTPLKGRYVVGFGKAFDIDFAEDTLTHVVIDKKK
ncbi:heme iron utilization protein [Solibacillus sp. R5-41]|uniref:pyridoxamine 5'-phosphate oxidase family protein n=1 Tax=Solibacillus sp. R5-41 TaxID=2048654 RepID=UPI000C128944|nr:pyridoxamine 5'-phosphate oxidase family protein [Solibacillus sp. R5-41]ATP41826.1 heme iron utilization protein [Solibacillus sp. R5-41]